MKIAAAALLLLIASADVATFTGKKEQVQLPAGSTYGWVWRCEYEFKGETFWRTFETSACPTTVEMTSSEVKSGT